LGKHTAATPCGRKNAEPLSLNNAAGAGKDTQGVTALLRSLTCINYRNMPNGSVTDVYLHPSALKGEAGLAALISLIKTYFARGGYGLQFNIFDRETLLDAQKHPEKYQTLQIRVCGWNVYFVTMSPFEQEQYINMNIHEAS
jgi:formate C-acetyltransferase